MLYLSLRLTKAEWTQDLIADVTPLHKSVRTMMQRADKAKATSHRNAALSPSMNEISLCATNSTVVVQILEFYSPNLIVQDTTKGTSK